MSTAIAEPPPVAEVKPVAEATKAEPPKSDLIASLLRPNVKVMDDKSKVVGETNPKVAETKVEEKKSEPVKVEEKKPTDQERNFAALRESKEAAEKRAAEYEARVKALTEEHETFRKSIPPDITEKLTAAEKRAEEAAKRAAEYDAQLRVSNLARHPDFVAKYQNGIKQQVDGMAALMKQAGIEPKEIQEALGRWDVNKLAEIHESMDPATKIRFQTMWGRAEELDGQRIAELEQADKAWGEIEKQQKTAMEQAQKDYRDGLVKAKSAILADLEKSQPWITEEPAVKSEIEALLDSAARLNGNPMAPDQILRNLANGHVLARHFQRVEKENGDLTAKLAETEKTLAERDAFIAKMSGASPTPGAGTGTAVSGDDKKALVSKLINPTVRI